MENTRNFHLLSSLRKQFPKISIELIVNEVCTNGCPFRTQHHLSCTKDLDILSFDVGVERRQKITSFLYLCSLGGWKEITPHNYIEYICTYNTIYPWDIKYYAKYGINKFKFVGRDYPKQMSKSLLKNYEFYFMGIEDESSIDNIPIKNLFSKYMFNEMIPDYLIKDIKPYLPSIKYFIKNGRDCIYKCRSQCKYCYSKIQLIEKKLRV